MPTIHKSKVEPYSVEQMFNLVNDVESYPNYLPWCKNVQILSQGDNSMNVKVEVAKGPLNKVFTTQNTLIQNKSISMRLLNGPFKYLEGEWSFESIDNNQCKITFDLNFELALGPFSKMLNPIFESLYSSLIKAFTDRARQLYGTKVI